MKTNESFAEVKNKARRFEVIFADQAAANADLRNRSSASAIRKDLEKNLKRISIC